MTHKNLTYRADVEGVGTTSSATSPHTYRPDIDGLRAVAVIAVVVFHAFPSAMPGGYAGVDIFFVISGYLITSILVASQREDRFSIESFYARRIRRIFPTLAIVLLATYAFGWISLTADEFKQLGKHILAGTAFVSNWALWTESGYFDAAANSKPLLHLWSLGVEEQFYIVWPLLVWIAFRFRKLGMLCLAVMVASFAANLLLVKHLASAAFYWPMTRMWELVVGAAVCVALDHTAVSRVAARWAAVLAFIGAISCGLAFFALGSTTVFPGWWALLPVAGAALLIAAGANGFTNRAVLGNPLAIWIGKISYAWYLWHWPLLSYASILAGGEPTASVRGLLVVASLLLAWITTAVIERPVLSGPPAKWKIAVPCLLLILAGYLGGLTYQRQGLAFRKGYSPDADVATATLGADEKFVSRTCLVKSDDRKLFNFCATDNRGPAHYAVWGDSKANAVYWGLVRKSSADQRWMLVGRAGCAPLVGATRVSSNGDDPQMCARANQIALRTLMDHPEIQTIVIAMGQRNVIGQSFVVDDSSDGQAPELVGLDNAIKALQQAGRRVALVLDNPTLKDPRQCMDRKPMAWPAMRHALGRNDQTAAQECAITYRHHVDAIAPYRALVDVLEKRHPDLVIYDPAQALCDANQGICPMVKNRHYLYSYADHVSDYASSLMAQQLLPLLDADRSELTASNAIGVTRSDAKGRETFKQRADQVEAERRRASSLPK